MGLNITVMSYLGHLDFGIVADREQMPDVWSLMDLLRQALDELRPAGAKPAAEANGGNGAAERHEPAADRDG